MENILFFFSSTIVGGAETNILKISRELTKTGKKVFWCFLVNNGPLLKNVDFELSGVLETRLFYKEPLTFYKNYKHFIFDNKIDIVFNFGLRVEIISRLLSKRIGVKRIISNIRSTDDWRKWHHVLLDKLTQSSVDLWVSNSIAGKEAFVKREGIPADKIKVIYNFYESPEIATHLAQNKSNLLRMGVLANITQEKGYFDLIKLAKELNKLNLNFKFIYAGIDKLNGAFEERVTEDNLNEQFQYLGYITDKTEFFNQIDIFFLPSYLEGMPTVILEAMAHEKPVISTYVGGIPEIIDNGINGYLCVPGDISAYVRSIVDIKEKNTLEIIKEANLKLKEFSKNLIMKKWLDVIST